MRFWFYEVLNRGLTYIAESLENGQLDGQPKQTNSRKHVNQSFPVVNKITCLFLFPKKLKYKKNCTLTF